jgi:hypothetical protein
MADAPVTKDTIDLTYNGRTKEVFMSFGLLNEISRAVGDVEQIGMISVDPDMRETVLKILLSERDEEGNIVKNFNMITAKITMDEVNRLIEWVADNVFDFFLKALGGAKRLQQKNEPRVLALMPKDPASTSSSPGSQG